MKDRNMRKNISGTYAPFLSQDVLFLLVGFNSSWDPSVCVLSQDTFAAQTQKGVLQRWRTNSNTSRKLTRLQPRKSLFISIYGYVNLVLAFFSRVPLACQSIENDFEKAYVVLEKKKSTYLAGQKFLEESKL